MTFHSQAFHYCSVHSSCIIISFGKTGTLWDKHIYKFTEQHLLHEKKKNPWKSSESHVNAKLFFRNSERETSYLELPNAYQKVRVCMQIAIVEEPQSFLKDPLLTLTDGLQRLRERDHFSCPFTDICSLVGIQNI